VIARIAVAASRLCPVECQSSGGRARRQRVWNDRSTTGGFHCPLSRSLPAIPAARGRERNIKWTVI